MRFLLSRVQAVPPWPIEAPPQPDASAVCNSRRHQLSGHSHGVTGSTGNRFAPSLGAHSMSLAPKTPATTSQEPPVTPGPGLALPLPRHATSAAPPLTDHPAEILLRVAGQDYQRRPPWDSRTPLSSLPQSRLQPWQASRQEHTQERTVPHSVIWTARTATKDQPTLDPLVQEARTQGARLRVQRQDVKHRTPALQDHVKRNQQLPPPGKHQESQARKRPEPSASTRARTSTLTSRFSSSPSPSVVSPSPPGTPAAASAPRRSPGPCRAPTRAMRAVPGIPGLMQRARQPRALIALAKGKVSTAPSTRWVFFHHNHIPGPSPSAPTPAPGPTARCLAKTWALSLRTLATPGKAKRLQRPLRACTSSPSWGACTSALSTGATRSPRDQVPAQGTGWPAAATRRQRAAAAAGQGLRRKPCTQDVTPLALLALSSSAGTEAVRNAVMDMKGAATCPSTSCTPTWRGSWYVTSRPYAPTARPAP